MRMEWVAGVIGVVAAISGIALGWSARAREQKKDAKQDGSEGGVLKTDVEYIKRGVDDIKLDMRSQAQRMEVFADRLARVEESAKQAHKRIDRLDNQKEE
ncbi:MAG TPA: hypothetical protein VN366_08385 [Feifaniaceae bacterium]|nr:hypothetical protein [Feifaniaceae bacterium]